MLLWRGGPNTRTIPAILLTLPPSKAADMAHLCVPQNQAPGVCRRLLPDIQVCGTHGRENLVNAIITSNTEEEGAKSATGKARSGQTARKNTRTGRRRWLRKVQFVYLFVALFVCLLFKGRHGSDQSTKLVFESGYNFSVPLDADVSVEVVVTRKSNTIRNSPCTVLHCPVVLTSLKASLVSTTLSVLNVTATC